MIAVTVDSDVKFTYSFITNYGNVLIKQTSEDWYGVYFQYRHATEDIQELLGTYRLLEEAVTAVSSGLTEQPDIEVNLSELKISSDLFDWERHFAGVRK